MKLNLPKDWFMKHIPLEEGSIEAGSPKYCDDPDNCAYSDCPTAFCDRTQSRAPTWYTAEEMRHYLRAQRYSEEIADELSANYAKNLQQAFNKGYQIGARTAHK